MFFEANVFRAQVKAEQLAQSSVASWNELEQGKNSDSQRQKLTSSSGWDEILGEKPDEERNLPPNRIGDQQNKFQYEYDESDIQI